LHLANIHAMHNQYNAMKAVYRIERVTTKFHDDKNFREDDESFGRERGSATLNVRFSKLVSHSCMGYTTSFAIVMAIYVYGIPVT
jgi:hypothetical protein